jgi:uncharacterized Zn finger protein
MHSILRFYNPVMHPVESDKEEVLSNKDSMTVDGQETPLDIISITLRDERDSI